MPKMIVMDLDDTLLRTDKSISQYTMDILKNVRNRGIKIVYATGRGSSAKNLVPPDLFAGHVLMNGAKAYINERVVYDRTIPKNIFVPFLRKLTGMNLKAAAEIGGIHYANFKVNSKWAYINNFVVTDFSNLTGDADKLYVLVEDPSQVQLVAPIIPQELYLNLSKDKLAMIMHKEATKFKASMAIAREFRISESSIIAFGDDINDKEMLGRVGLGVAVDNAIQEVKMAADHICGTNDDDGVAKWLEKHIRL